MSEADSLKIHTDRKTVLLYAHHGSFEFMVMNAPRSYEAFEDGI